jgi:hypothetical protein
MPTFVLRSPWLKRSFIISEFDLTGFAINCPRSLCLLSLALVSLAVILAGLLDGTNSSRDHPRKWEDNYLEA